MPDKDLAVTINDLEHKIDKLTTTVEKLEDASSKQSALLKDHALIFLKARISMWTFIFVGGVGLAVLAGASQLGEALKNIIKLAK